jgi:hypothetical protein
MMFEAFGVHLGHLAADAETEQEVEHEQVARA